MTGVSAILTDDELTECAELLEPLLSLRATAMVAEVRESRATIATLTAERNEARDIIRAHLPHPNGPNATTPGDVEAWNVAMFNIGQLRKERDEAQSLLSRTIADGRIVESMTVEAIAVWLDTNSGQFTADSIMNDIAIDVRAGVWKAKP